MHRAILLILSGTVVLNGACATGVTSGTAVDDDDGVGGAGVTTGVGAMTSAGGMAGAGGSPTTVGPGGTGGMPVGDAIWINEIHYDNDGTDTGEGIEVAGVAGLDLTQYEIELYNEGVAYDLIALTGSLPDQQNGLGTAWVSLPANGLQNGPSDGVALVRTQTSQVLFFIGYEGTSTASDGNASGMTAMDIGVEEAGTTPAGQSLQLTGTGNSYADFTWAGPATATPGQPNGGQTLQ
jgi:hypothetical protein